MKIALTTQDDQIFEHFGKCTTFTVFEVENGKIQGKTLIDAIGHGHAELAGFLKGAGVDVVICGGIGNGARNMLDFAGIRLVSGISGSIDDAINAYLNGNLSDNNGNCSHKSHEHGQHCNCKNHCN